MQENRTQDFEFGKGYVLKGYRKKSRFFGFCFFILSIALVVSFSLFSANLIVGVSLPASGSALLKERTYYLLSLGSFDNEENASEFAKEVKVLEGAGYIYYNKTYEVIAFVYGNEQDCLKVKDKVIGEYSKAHVIPLQCKKISATISKDYKQSVIECLNVFDECYSILFSLASSYESSKEYYTSMNLINDFILNIESKKTSLKEINSSFAVKLKTKLSELVVELKSLVDISEGVDTFASRLKNAACYSVFCRYNLA